MVKDNITIGNGSYCVCGINHFRNFIEYLGDTVC